MDKKRALPDEEAPVNGVEEVDSIACLSPIIDVLEEHLIQHTDLLLQPGGRQLGVWNEERRKHEH